MGDSPPADGSCPKRFLRFCAKISFGMQLLDEYAAVLIVAGQVLAVAGVLLIAYLAIRQRMHEKVEVAEKPERRGLPYPDLYYWHVIRQRSSLGERIKRVFKKGRSQGM